MKRSFLFRLVIVVVTALSVPPRPARADSFITLASTTSVQDSGLLARILPLFKQATGIDVQVIAVGSGEALDAARKGEADLVLVHDPAAEHQFVREWHASSVREIAWNDFVIVGPIADPAGIKDGRDARIAFKAIWKKQAPFVSRGDRSGTDAIEKLQWHLAELDVTKAGPWYREIRGGMAAALNAAASIDAYTLSDRGTWISFKNRRNLTILVEGDKYLINRYDVIELNPELHSEAKLHLAHQFADWLASPVGQKAIASYELDGHKLFHPEADPKPKGMIGGQ
jgi:tungstate transport system substrate-binding protein